MHTIVCQVLEQVKQVILGVLIFSSHPILITPSSNTVRLFQQNHLPGLHKTAAFNFNKINTAWLMTAIPLDATISIPLVFLKVMEATYPLRESSAATKYSPETPISIEDTFLLISSSTSAHIPGSGDLDAISYFSLWYLMYSRPILWFL